MGRAILEMQDLYIAVELPDDVVREFILEALGGKLGELPGKPPQPSTEATPESDQPAAAQEELPLCACGCGKRVKTPGAKYLRGHNVRREKKVREILEETLTELQKSGKTLPSQREILVMAGLPLGTYYYNILKKVAVKLGIQLPQAPSGGTPALNTSKRVASLEDAILDILQESKNGLKVRQVAKKLWKRGFNVSLAKVRNTLQKLIKEDKVKVDKSFAKGAYRYFINDIINDNGVAKTFCEKDILRAFYLEKQKVEDIAEQFDITPEQVLEIVKSEKGKLYAEVNCNFDAEKLQETLKKEVELMKDLTKDAAGVES
ncbi:hypothetical protein [Candidatus Pyrohabitans sp.]